MHIKAFITHKKKERFSDCQDRFRVDAVTKSVAVSDGMGSTWQQKIWAQLLVDKYTQDPEWTPSKESIAPLCREWKKGVEDFIQKLKETNASESLIYRNERFLAEGRSAGATLVGARFHGKEWEGFVLGDSCLIEWNGTRASFYTSQEKGSFDNYPDYFDSNVTKDGRGTPKPIRGILSTNSYILFVSDPFSDFLLEHNKNNDIAKYINRLLCVSTHDEFELMVEDWRNEGMHNDDATLVIIQEDDKDDFSLIMIDDLDTLIKNENPEKVLDKVAKTPIDNHSEEQIYSICSSDELNSNDDRKDEEEFLDKIIRRFNNMKINQNRKVRKLVSKITEEMKKLIRSVMKEYTITKK